MKINWNWPRTPENKLAPWYVIARRLIATPVVVIGTLLLSIGYAMAGEYRMAQDVWWD